MWIIVLFDLPTDTKQARKRYSEFRKSLLQDGFTMMQFSVYKRHCSSEENAVAHINRVKYNLPTQGKISIIKITDKQFGRIETFYGKKPEKSPKPPEQLTIF